MQRDETLILQILKTLRGQCFEEHRLLKTIQRQTLGELSGETILLHLEQMQQCGLLKNVPLRPDGRAYVIDWAGHDYLDER